MPTAQGSATQTFSNRLTGEFAAKRHLCAGIDPTSEILDSWHLEVSAVGAENSVERSSRPRLGLLRV